MQIGSSLHQANGERRAAFASRTADLDAARAAGERGVARGMVRCQTSDSSVTITRDVGIAMCIDDVDDVDDAERLSAPIELVKSNYHHRW